MPVLVPNDLAAHFLLVHPDGLGIVKFNGPEKARAQIAYYWLDDDNYYVRGRTSWKPVEHLPKGPGIQRENRRYYIKDFFRPPHRD